MADKDVSAMLDLLAPLAERVFTLRPESPRAMEAEALAELLEARGVPARACGMAGEGGRSALESAGRSGVVCALGSLYLSGDIRRAVEALSQ